MPIASEQNRVRPQSRSTATSPSSRSTSFSPQKKNDSKSKKRVSTPLTTKLKKSHDAIHRKRSNDANESILTQYSYATYRPAIDKDEARRSFDVTATSTDYFSTTLTEDSETGEEHEYSSTTPESQGNRINARSLPKVTKRSNPPIFKIPYLGKSSQPPVELIDWIIRPLPDVKGVCVEGQKKGMHDFWHSSAITDVKRRKFVKTASGTVYRLRGKLNKLCTLDTGFSKNVAHAFANGFPADWKKIIQKFYSNLEHSISINDECSVVRGYSLKRLGGLHKKRSRKNMIGKKEQAMALNNLDSILTPVGLVKRCNSADNFTTTRSGRLSLPPLAQWQGQRYIISTKSNTLSVGFQTSQAETALLNDTNRFMKLTKNLQKPLYHKSLSNSMLENPNTSLIKNIAKKRQTLTISNLHEKTNVTGTVKKQQQRIVSGNKSNSKKKPAEPTPVLKHKDNLPSAQSIVNVGRIIDLTSSHDLKENQERLKIRGKSSGSAQVDSLRVHLVDCLKETILTRSMTKKNRSDTLDTDVSKDRRDGPNRRLSLSPLFLKSPGENDVFDASVDTSSTKESMLDCSMVLRNRTVIKHDLPDCYIEESKKYNRRSDETNKKVQKQKRQKGKITGDKMEQKQGVGDVCKSKSVRSNKGEITCDGKEKKRDQLSRKRKYFSSPVSDDTGYSTEEQSCLKLQQDSTPKSCGKDQARKRRKLSLSTVVEKEQGNIWTVEEKELFERALRSVDLNSPNLWSLVSNIVSSKNDSECRLYHATYLEQKTKKEPERKKITRKSSGRQKGEPVRGGKKTLKRKGDMREFLKEQDEGYADNLFDSTPFVSRKLPMPIMSNIDFDKDDSEIFGSNHNFITPMTKNSKLGTPGTRLRAQLASTRKTPTNQVSNHSVNDTPIAVIRQIADKYIFMNQQKRKPNESSSSGPQTEMENTSKMDFTSLPSKSLFSPSILVYDKEKQIEDEDEDENNPFIYYWNEEGNE